MPLGRAVVPEFGTEGGGRTPVEGNQLWRQVRTAAPNRTPDDGDRLVARADGVVAQGGACAADPATFLVLVLSDLMDKSLLDPLDWSGPARSGPRCSTRSRSLDGAAVRTPTRLSTSFCLPGQRMSPPRGGDLLLRRGLGEPGIGHVAVIAVPGCQRGGDGKVARARLLKAIEPVLSTRASSSLERIRIARRTVSRAGSPAAKVSSRGTRCCYALARPAHVWCVSQKISMSKVRSMRTEPTPSSLVGVLVVPTS